MFTYILTLILTESEFDDNLIIARLAWDFSVGQLSSKVLKSSQLVRFVFFLFVFFSKKELSIVVVCSPSLQYVLFAKTLLVISRLCWLCIAAFLEINQLFFSVVGYLSSRSVLEPPTVWRCEPTRHEAGLFVSEREDAHGGAARGTFPWSALAAPNSSRKHSKLSR